MGQQGFSDAGVGLTIVASTVSWRVKDPVAQKEKDIVAHKEREETGVLILVLGLSVLILMACAFAVCCCGHRRPCRKKADVDADVQGKPVESVEDAEKVDAEKGEKGSGG